MISWIRRIAQVIESPIGQRVQDGAESEDAPCPAR